MANTIGRPLPPDPESDAIVGVIRDGIAALRQRDFDAWSRTWVQAPYSRRAGQRNFDACGIAPVCNVLVQDGWEAIRSGMKPIFDDEQLAIYPHGTQYEDLYVRVRGDTAWVTFDQYPLDASGEPAPETFGFMRETRMLERHSNEWKFSYLGFFHEAPQRPAEAVVRVDQHAAFVGMTHEAAERIGESEALCVRNGRLRAADRDVDKRLLAAIRTSARASPWTAGAAQVPFLARTPWGSSDCFCWIAPSLDMMDCAVIVIGDTSSSRRRLQNAILVYRLSPAQARLAALIIDGHDVVTAADELGVTVNTARTHLHRMFEKTGVRSQPALVASLLSVAATLK